MFYRYHIKPGNNEIIPKEHYEFIMMKQSIKNGDFPLQDVARATISRLTRKYSADKDENEVSYLKRKRRRKSANYEHENDEN